MDSWKENYFLTGETQDQIHFRSIGKMIRLTPYVKLMFRISLKQYDMGS